jgi:predicted esterase
MAPLAGAWAFAVLISTASAGEVTASRADLARSYLRFERALMRDPAALAHDAARLNDAFDRVSLAFFTGAYATSCRTLDELALELDGLAGDASARFARSLRLEGLPPVVVRPVGGDPSPLRLRLVPAWRDESAPFQPGAALELVVRRPQQPDLAAQRSPLEFDADGVAQVEVAATGMLAVAGPIEATLEWRSGREVLAASTVVRSSLDGAREALLRQVGGAATPTVALAAARASCMARAALLRDEPSPMVSAQFLVEPLALLREVHREAAALAAGRDPYAGREGDLWRVLVSGQRTIPLRTYVPAAAASAARDGGPPLPVVIALHGAGGDENMFMDGYGAGLLRQLADRHGFVAAAPATGPFAADADAVARLIEDLASLHPIDRARVHLIGHSMGAGAAATMARRDAERLAGVACLAGGAFPTRLAEGERFARTRVVVGMRDPIVPAAGVLRSARAAAAAGLPVSIEEHAEFGHTLLVAHALPGVIEWLLGG